MVEVASYSVLVVDDHAPARYALARALRAAGFTTLEAAGGAEALERAQAASAVVLDVHLPDLLGIEVCRLLRTRPATKALPIILVSAVYLDEPHRTAALAAGADAYLTPPLDTDEIVARVRDLLAIRGAAPQASKRPRRER